MSVTDAIKTIREALDDLWFVAPEPSSNASAALDSLEAELATLRARLAPAEKSNPGDTELCEALSAVRVLLPPNGLGALEVIERRLNDYDLLSARLAPADSPPGDEWLRLAVANMRDAADQATDDEAPNFSGDLHRVCDAAEAHLRSQQPESDDQRAERELGAWLVAHPGWTYSARVGPTGAEVTLWTDRAGHVDIKSQVSSLDAAILDALAKARDAEDGKS